MSNLELKALPCVSDSKTSWIMTNVWKRLKKVSIMISKQHALTATSKKYAVKKYCYLIILWKPCDLKLKHSVLTFNVNGYLFKKKINLFSNRLAALLVVFRINR